MQVELCQIYYCLLSISCPGFFGFPWMEVLFLVSDLDKNQALLSLKMYFKALSLTSNCFQCDLLVFMTFIQLIPLLLVVVECIFFLLIVI